MKKVLLVSENEGLYKSLRRALKATGAIKVENYAGGFYGKQSVVIKIMDNNSIDAWLWMEFRKRALNPLIVIGMENKSSFIQNNPVFANYPEEHAYFQIPFDLNVLSTTIGKLKPIYDNVTRKLIVNGYSKGYEYKLITHNLKIIKGDKSATIKNLLQVKDFYHSKGDNKMAKIIDEKVKEISNNKGNWEEVAWSFKQYLEKRLETKGKL